MVFKEIKENEIIEVAISGKKITIDANDFNSEDFTNFVISNANEIITNEVDINIEDKDSDIIKFFKQIFKSVVSEELEL